MKKSLYLFRHGQSKWNRLNKVQGTFDIPLTSLGIQQAKKIPQYLKDKGLEVIFSSHLKRAWKTGKIVAKALGVKIVKSDNLHEVCWGDVQGKTVEEIRAEFGKEFDDKWSGNDPKYDNLKFPNGESKIEARQRMVKAVSELSLNSSCNIIGFASHGFVIKQMIIACGSENFKGFKNCEIVNIQFDIEKFDEKNPSKAFNFVERISVD